MITFEIEAANVDKARANIKAAGLESRVEQHLGDSRLLLGDVLRTRTGLRFAFLDASHLYENVLNEFNTILPKLADDALVLFDNTYRIAEGKDKDERVNGALKSIQKEHGGNLINLEFVSWYTPGLALWQRTPKL